jgi:hypothetical protein
MTKLLPAGALPSKFGPRNPAQSLDIAGTAIAAEKRRNRPIKRLSIGISSPEKNVETNHDNRD